MSDNRVQHTIPVLVLGKNGQLGTALALTRPDNVDLTVLERQQYDPAFYGVQAQEDMHGIEEGKSDYSLCFQQLDSLWKTQQPGFIINAAAYTDVDGAQDPKNAEQVYLANVALPDMLACYAEQRGHMLIHVSTDYVFSGEHVAHAEYGVCKEVDDPVDPINVYGQSKAEGERRVLNNQQCVVRTSWLYSAQLLPDHHDFVSTMSSLQDRGVAPGVVNDQWARPTYVGDLAQGLWELVEHRAGATTPAERTEHADLTVRDTPPGILHYSNGGAVISWYDFATEVFLLRNEIVRNETVRKDTKGNESGISGGIMPSPVSTEEYPTVAPRPGFTALSLDSWESEGFSRPRAWQDALQTALHGRL